MGLEKVGIEIIQTERLSLQRKYQFWGILNEKKLFLENVCLSCLFGSSCCALTTVPILLKCTPNIFGSTYEPKKLI